jgi:hypothetical protein
VALTARQLGATHEGERLRITFRDGESASIKLISVALPNKYDATPESRGIVYDLISTDQNPPARKTSACWSRLDEIESFEIIEQGLA